MAPSLGVNLRVTGQLDRGDRKYMEDFFSVAYQQTEDEKDLEYAFFGIFDGHGGREAAVFAKEHLMDFIVNDKRFWCDNDDDVLKAISNGFIQTHYAMWKDQVNWPKTSSGLPSTSGTTASIAFIRKGNIYIGHVGDSSIVLGYQVEGKSLWKAKALTKDHKPEDEKEEARIESSGGKVVRKSGVPRVVWNRPRLGHKGPVRRSTPIDEIPFLAVARSLGDLWSYNSDSDQFVVSPQPDVQVIKIDVETHRCLIFGTDGLWNMLRPEDGVNVVQSAEQHNEIYVHCSNQPASSRNQMWINPSKSLVDRALRCWARCGSRADNTSAVTLMLDPPGPPRRTVLRKMQIIDHPVYGTVKEAEAGIEKSNSAIPSNDAHCNSEAGGSAACSSTPPDSEGLQERPSSGGVAIFTRLAPSTSSILPAVLTDCKRPMMGTVQSIPSASSNCHSPPQQHVEQHQEQQSSNDVHHTPASPASVCSTSSLPSVQEASHSASRFISTDQSVQPPTRSDSSTDDVPKSLPQDNGEGEKEPVSSVQPRSMPKQEQRSMEPQLRHAQKRLRGSCTKATANETLSLNRPEAIVNTTQPSLIQSALHFPMNNASGDSGLIRRRHSSVLDTRTSSADVNLSFARRSLGYSTSYGAGVKRRTRSEDKLHQSVGRLEDDMRTSDEENERIAWPGKWNDKNHLPDEGSENNVRSCSSRRRKRWLRSSGSSLGRMKQAKSSGCMRQNSSFLNTSVLSGNRSYSEGENSPRILRSDTLAAAPVRTLRSRNVDLKASRLSLHTPSKRSAQLKAALEMTSYTAGPSSLVPGPKVSLTTSVGTCLTKRHRQTFCGRTRCMTTRSRVKRLSK